MKTAVFCATLLTFSVYYSPVVAAVPLTTICKLAADPSQWRGRTVRIKATYFSDRMHYDGFIDDRCRKIWFAPRDPKKFDASLGAFYRAVSGDGRSVRTTDFDVDIIGRVSYRREGRSSGRITILRVLNYREFERPKRPPESGNPRGS